MADKTEDTPSFDLDPKVVAKIDATPPPKQQTALPDYAADAQVARSGAVTLAEDQAVYDALLVRGAHEWRRELWSQARLFVTAAAAGGGVYLLYWMFAGRHR